MQGDVLVLNRHNRAGMWCSKLIRALLVVVPGHVVAQVLPALRSLRVGLQSRVGRSRWLRPGGLEGTRPCAHRPEVWSPESHSGSRVLWHQPMTRPHPRCRLGVRGVSGVVGVGGGGEGCCGAGGGDAACPGTERPAASGARAVVRGLARSYPLAPGRTL